MNTIKKLSTKNGGETISTHWNEHKNRTDKYKYRCKTFTGLVCYIKLFTLKNSVILVTIINVVRSCILQQLTLNTGEKSAKKFAENKRH